MAGLGFHALSWARSVVGKRELARWPGTLSVREEAFEMVVEYRLPTVEVVVIEYSIQLLAGTVWDCLGVLSLPAEPCSRGWPWVVFTDRCAWHLPLGVVPSASCRVP